MGFFGLIGCKQKMDLANVYPYIITRDYLTQGIKDETVIVDTIGTDLFVTLVKDLNGIVENVKKSDLEKNGISVKQAFDTAISNLDKVLKNQIIKATLFNGPNGLPFIIFTDHWLSAAAALSTNIYSFGSKNLNSDSIYISIPQRDVLILFAKCNNSQLNDFKKMIQEKESDSRKPLTFDIFQLDKNGIQRIK